MNSIYSSKNHVKLRSAVIFIKYPATTFFLFFYENTNLKYKEITFIELVELPEIVVNEL